MGYFGKLNLKKQAVEMRKKGYSIRQIEKELGVARSSASSWVREVQLTKEQINVLYRNKKSGGLKGSYIASQNKIKERLSRTKQIEEVAKKEIGKLSKRDRFIFGVALYFGEGSKTSHNISFTNSDPSSILFMKNWLVEFCNINVSNMVFNLYIHSNLDESKAKDYWALLLKVPKAQFRKTYVVKNNKNRLRNTKHENGICRITVSRVDTLRRIIGWIKAGFTTIL